MDKNQIVRKWFKNQFKPKTCTLPETNISPENMPWPQKERLIFQPSKFQVPFFLLVSGRVTKTLGQKKQKNITLDELGFLGFAPFFL